MLQLENLRGLGPEHFTTLLPDMPLMWIVAGISSSRRWFSVNCPLPLLGCPGLGCFLKMMDVCLYVVDISKDRPPVSS